MRDEFTGAAVVLAALLGAACGPAARGVAPASPAPHSPRRDPAGGGAPAQAPTPAGPAGPGESAATALEVCRPAGEEAHVAGLRCPDGSPPTTRRIGRAGPRHPAADGDADALLRQTDPDRPLDAGETDHHIVDRFEVTCGDQRRDLYLDMYHCAAN